MRQEAYFCTVKELDELGKNKDRKSTRLNSSHVR